MIDQLFARLETTNCPYCESGTLVVGQFEGSPAVVCEACGTPSIRQF